MYKGQAATTRAKVVLHLYVCTGKGLKQPCCHGVGVNRYMTDITIGRSNIVIKRTDLVLVPKLVADVVPTAISEDADSLLKRDIS